MKGFSHEITNDAGEAVGRCSGRVCVSTKEVFETMGFVTDDAFMKKWVNRIPGGIKFPCCVLTWIEVDGNNQDKGLGTEAINRFNSTALGLGAVMGMVRIGWFGDPPEVRQSKSLHFYRKTNWTLLEREDELEHFIAYRVYD